MNLFEYALCSKWDDRLEQLSSIAEPERWHYRKLPSDRKLPVLHDYLRFTFRRCLELGLVVEDGDHACFNTGLLTPHHEQIFAYFRAATPEFGPEDFQGRWWLHSWQVESSHHLARFDALPEVASYWTDPATIVFDPRKRVIPQIEHIIEDNWERFPTEFGGTVGSDGIPQSLTAAPDEDEVMSQRVADEDDDEASIEAPEVRARPEVPEHTRFVLRNLLDGAISRSVRLAERSYRVAVPQRYNGRIQLLLPLYLRGANDVDLALTLELQGDRHRAATVLLPDWAYTHARLLSRPNSEWLGGFRGES
jgi:hypothetical protein